MQGDNKTMFTQNSNSPPVLKYLRTQQNDIMQYQLCFVEYRVPTFMHTALRLFRAGIHTEPTSIDIYRPWSHFWECCRWNYIVPVTTQA